MSSSCTVKRRSNVGLGVSPSTRKASGSSKKNSTSSSKVGPVVSRRTATQSLPRSRSRPSRTRRLDRSDATMRKSGPNTAPKVGVAGSTTPGWSAVGPKRGPSGRRSSRASASVIAMVPPGPAAGWVAMTWSTMAWASGSVSRNSSVRAIWNVSARIWLNPPPRLRKLARPASVATLVPATSALAGVVVRMPIRLNSALVRQVPSGPAKLRPSAVSEQSYTGFAVSRRQSVPQAALMASSDARTRSRVPSSSRTMSSAALPNRSATWARSRSRVISGAVPSGRRRTTERSGVGPGGAVSTGSVSPPGSVSTAGSVSTGSPSDGAQASARVRGKVARNRRMRDQSSAPKPTRRRRPTPASHSR